MHNSNLGQQRSWRRMKQRWKKSQLVSMYMLTQQKLSLMQDNQHHVKQLKNTRSLRYLEQAVTDAQKLKQPTTPTSTISTKA